uniref:non-specific serine/threonine protein kinase n=1 Tax=Plectus sambesii TaxID=2011161 RepID=A0A914VU82_9BILA
MNNYEKLSVVGRGAHGICYLCRRADGEKVIVKQIPVDGMSAQEKQATLGEVKLLQMLGHPNIIGYYENFIEDSALCIVMQYAQGGTLCDMLEQRSGCLMDEERILHYFTQIVLSLHHLHSKQILHRDLKTQNILLNRARTICKLSDFGISKHLETHSRASTVIGTPSYLSPEICEGRAYNHKSDLWSLGCILYEMVTLKRAFDAPTFPALVMKITKGKFDPVGDHVSAPLKSLISSLLNLNENRRPELRDILTSPLMVPVALRLTLEMGTVSLPAPIKPGQLTPNIAQRLRTRPDNRLSQHMTPRTKYDFVRQRIVTWDSGMKNLVELTLSSTSTPV